MKLFKAILISALVFTTSTVFAQVDAENLAKDSAPPTETDMKIEDEAPPPPEAPYPNAKTEESPPLKVTKPVQKPNPLRGGQVLGKPKTIPSTAPQTPLSIERPKAIEDEDTYIYERGTTTDETDVSKVPVKEKSNSESNLNVTPPVIIKKNGDYFYGYDVTPHEHSASLKVGLFPPPNLKNPHSGLDYKTLYNDGVTPTFMFDYEWQFHRSFGDLGLRLGSGVFYQTPGQGRFVNSTDPDRDPAYVPDVNFTMIAFPNTVTGLYHFRFSDTQIFTPYFGGGGGFFVFAELRDDNLAPKFGGAAVAVALGGLNIMIDGVEAAASRELESGYGISHVALNIELTQFVGLNPTYDFTASVISFGFNLEF